MPNSLAVNSKIAVASIRATTIDFTAFAGEIGRTLNVTRATWISSPPNCCWLQSGCCCGAHRALTFQRRQHEAVNSLSSGCPRQ